MIGNPITPPFPLGFPGVAEKANLSSPQDFTAGRDFVRLARLLGNANRNRKR